MQPYTSTMYTVQQCTAFNTAKREQQGNINDFHVHSDFHTKPIKTVEAAEQCNA